MMTVYVKTGCPFCGKVLAKLKELDLPFNEKNIADEGVVAELLERGGKRQVPFMEDDNMTPYLVDDDVEMYESSDIVAYLEKKYKKKGPVVEVQAPIYLHRESDESVCDGCQ
jgi:glutathione S-transferase